MRNAAGHRMGLNRIIHGAVRLELTGALVEELVNDAAAAGIKLTDVESRGAYVLRLTVDERDLPALRAMAEKRYLDVHQLALRGGSESRAMLRRRAGLLVLAAVTGMGLFLASLFIWEVDIRGAEHVSHGRILRALEDSGLHYGSFWPALSSGEIRNTLLLRLPELAWASVNLNGSRAEVLVLERSEKPEIYQQTDFADLTAKTAGIVTRTAVRNGKCTVMPGALVTPGELLIAGTVDSLTAEPRKVRALGEIWAQTFHECTAVCPLPEEKKTGGGRGFSRFAVKIGEKRVNFYINSGNPIDEYDKIQYEIKLGIPGLFTLPVSLIGEIFTEIRTVPDASTRTDEITARLKETLRQGIEGEVLAETATVSESDSLLTVTLRAQCEENIAVLSK